MAGDEARRRTVLDVSRFAVGPDHSKLARLVPCVEKGLPGRVEVYPGLDEVVESSAAQLLDRQSEEHAGAGVGLDDRSHIVDDEHSVSARAANRQRSLLTGHVTYSYVGRS